MFGLEGAELMELACLARANRRAGSRETIARLD